MRSLKTRILLAFAGIIAIALCAPTTATATATVPPSIPSIPDTLTDEQMNNLAQGGELVVLIQSEANSAPTTRSSDVRAAAGSSCKIEVGRMWKRTSGGGKPAGTVGGKPRLYDCTSDVRRTGLSSDVYRWNGWTWNRVAGSFVSHGTGNMQPKFVEYTCKNTKESKFKIVSTGWGTNARGQTGVKTSQSSPYTLKCS